MAHPRIFLPALVALTLLPFSTGAVGDDMAVQLSTTGGGGTASSPGFVVIGGISGIARTAASGGSFVINSVVPADSRSPFVFSDGFEGEGQ